MNQEKRVTLWPVINTKSFLNMKKIFLLLAIMLPLVLSSCGDDKDILSSMEQDLVGEWAIIKTADTQNDIHYVFNKDRTGSRWLVVDGQAVSPVPFDWTFDGKRLTLSYAGQKLVMDVTLGINKLHIVYLETGAVEDYQRVVKPDDDDD